MVVFERIVAYLKKIETFILDRRFAATVLAIYGLLQLLGLVVDEIDVEALVNTTAGAVAAAITLVTFVGAVVALARKLIDSWTIREPSGVTAWLSPKKPAG